MFPLILPSCIFMRFSQDKTKSCKRCHRWKSGWSFLATNYYQDQNHLSMMMVMIVMTTLMMMVMMQPKVCWNRMRRDEPIRAAMSTVTECQLRPDIAETPWDTIYHHHHHHHGRPRHHYLENQEQRGLLVSNAMTTGSKPKPSLLPTLLLFPSWTPLPSWQHVMMMSMKKFDMRVVTLEIFTILTQTIMMITPAHSPRFPSWTPTWTRCGDEDEAW